MAAHRRSDRRRVCRCAGGLRKRASRRRKPVRFAFGRVTDCVSGTAKGNTRVRGEFDLVMPRRSVRADEKLTAFLDQEAGLVAERQEATCARPGAVSPLPAGTAGPLDPTP
jgi:hypothetical protein